MKEKIIYLMGKKSFHICVMIIIVAIIFFALGVIVLKYNVEGETNMPFNLKKITVISSSEGIDKDAGENKWAFDINQNNDIFLYIEKNKNYGKQEIIKSISIENINIEKTINKGTIKIYKPNSSQEGKMFSNMAENEVQSIEYVGALETKIGNLEVSNQGGIIVFRYANDKISEYISNDEEINHNDLLKKANVTEGDLQAKLNFDIVIKVEAGREYKASVSLDVPINGIIDNGTTSSEITALNDVIFKRIKN